MPVLTTLPNTASDSTASGITASAIDCQSLSVTFASGITAVDDVSLQLNAGQIHSLIGPSGCGKTTLLRAIAGLQPATEGQVLLTPPTRGDHGQIGFVFQQPALLPWLTTRENVMLPLELLPERQSNPSAGENEQRVNDMLCAVKLDDAADRMPSQLSGGMKMRASIARALITQPSVLLLDEPFAALDDMLREQLGQLLLSLWQQRRFTVVLVTHNIAESILMSHQIVVMRNAQAAPAMTNPLPFPRSSSLRSTASFAAFYGQVSERLRGSDANGDGGGNTSPDNNSGDQRGRAPK